MKNYVAFLGTIILLGFLAHQTQAQAGVEALLNQAESFKNMEYEKALALYERVLTLDENNETALFEAAFLHTRVGKNLSDEKKKKEHYYRAKELADKYLALAPESADAHYAVAVSMGRLVEIVSAKERVEGASVILEHAKKATEIDPNHAAAWHAYGKVSFRLANMSMIEKAAAAVLYGGLPDGASNENALIFYKKAMDLRPEYILYKLEYAAALQHLGQEEKARKLLTQIGTMPEITADDKRYKEDAATLLSHMK